ncbi:unnamed protein product [Sphagnum balticum]
MRGRIKEDDVPPTNGEFFYYKRKAFDVPDVPQYTMLCSRRIPRGAGPGDVDEVMETRNGAPDKEILLDENLEAKEDEFYHIGDLKVSPNHKLFAVAEDIKDSLPRAVVLPAGLSEALHTGVEDVSVQESAKSPSQRLILWHGRSPPHVEHMNRKPVNTLSSALWKAYQHFMGTFPVASPVDDTAEVVSGEISKVDSELADVVLKDKAPQVPRKKLSLPSKWRKGELLGSGSFGTVYEGVGNNGSFFAVKEVSLLDEGKEAKQSILHLQQEIALLSELEHENIVQYLGTESTGDKLYIFLELVSKGSLVSVYKKYPMVEEQVCAYTQQILHGLKYLHDRNIIHRDIKCANLLVDVSGVVKLADFGMAKEIDKLDKLKSCKGSAYWMAPEVIDATKTYGIAADIWSLGCTVLEMVTGKPPLSELEWQAVLWRVGHGEAPPIPENMSPDLKDFIKQCLEVDVNKRPTVDMLFTHPLVCSKPTLGPFRLVATTELSTIAQEKSFHSSNTGTTDATDKEAKNHTQGGVLRVVRERLGHSLRTIRNELFWKSIMIAVQHCYHFLRENGHE